MYGGKTFSRIFLVSDERRERLSFGTIHERTFIANAEACFPRCIQKGVAR